MTNYDLVLTQLRKSGYVDSDKIDVPKETLSSIISKIRRREGLDISCKSVSLKTSAFSHPKTKKIYRIEPKTEMQQASDDLYGS